ncbi:hypothetical protein MT325_m265L [Paramecium bursaria chlorella virus MT325]|uniref:Uncharacterized protein m265L n=2 Tax=Paramecium bursaria Chlorella virus A1 TaxID=381899 RepID=A7ITZ5_PBCVM|nr:hypothetical protein FR483_n270L [Paramecium bursaria Chlorella virus FR483]ABT13819.1 hypothetical protein MT325_m265L [Paramecium bursaria chlorella virus MT325]ABT15555.1 hypothetical protein FR483_n270L [Paramecium bursaria Chlorella virus FR483]
MFHHLGNCQSEFAILVGQPLTNNTHRKISSIKLNRNGERGNVKGACLDVFGFNLRNGIISADKLLCQTRDRQHLNQINTFIV